MLGLNLQMAYISGPLTGLPEDLSVKLKAFYERIAELCKECGFMPYLPHKVSDPVTNTHLTPQEVDRIDRRAVTKAAVMIAYVGVPSLGVGIEVEMAHHAQTPVILVAERDKLERREISRLVRGSPAVYAELPFDWSDKSLFYECLCNELQRLVNQNSKELPKALC